MDMMKTSRRTLLKGAAAAAMTAPVGMASAKNVKNASSLKWAKTAEVVILGYGNSGTNAAIAAKDAGASVLILEKLDVGGGNVSVSAGGFVVPTNEQE